jgi:RNA polymerase primary sigma factor
MKRILQLSKDAPVKDTGSLDRYFREIGKNAPLTNEQELDLFTRYNNDGDLRAKEIIVKANLKFVITVAKTYQRSVKDIQLSDLIALGNIGLLKAIDRFDVTLKYRFISFAVWWIRKSIVESLRTYNTVIQYPQNYYLSNNKIKNWIDEFYKIHEREPSDEEVCTYIEEEGLNVTAHADVFYEKMINLDELVDSGKGETGAYIDIIENVESMKPDQAFEIDDSVEIVDKLLTNLNYREKQIMIYFFGLKGQPALSLEDIADKLNVTTERVRQIKRSVLEKFRDNPKNLL